MHTEFITLNSKLIIRNNVIIEKKLKKSTEEGFTRAIAVLTLLSGVIFCFYKIVQDKDYISIIQLVLLLIWLEPHIKRVYKSLFVNTWKYAIRFHEIQSIKSDKLDNGLETCVIIQLKNGRKKFITFRNAENQIESFIHLVEVEAISTGSVSQ